MQGDPTDLLNFSEMNPYADLERSSVTCNDLPKFAPLSPEEVTDELLRVYRNVTQFVFSVVTLEADAGCQYWPVTPPERFTGPWNNTLRNPILILSSTVSGQSVTVHRTVSRLWIDDAIFLYFVGGSGHTHGQCAQSQSTARRFRSSVTPRQPRSECFPIILTRLETLC